MTAVQAIVHQLEAYVQEELDLQTRTLAALREQESALFQGDAQAIRAHVERLDVQVHGTASRLHRRAELLRKLGASFGVAPSTLTLSSICTRLGPDGARLARLAGELRETTASVMRATRRLAALARMHVRLNDDILASVFQSTAGESSSLDGSGVLLDARV